MSGTPLEVHVSRGAETIILAPRGELDLHTIPLLAGALEDVLEAGTDGLVMDLRLLEFMDSTGLRLIIDTDSRCEAEGRPFSLVPGHGVVQRVFDVTGLTNKLRWTDPPTGVGDAA